MAFQHLYSRDQQQAAIDAICASEGCATGEMPRSLGWLLGRRADALRARWPALSLEDRVGHIAVQQGGYVPGDASIPQHVLTHGYEALCRTGSLCAPESAH